MSSARSSLAVICARELRNKKVLLLAASLFAIANLAFAYRWLRVGSATAEGCRSVTVGTVDGGSGSWYAQRNVPVPGHVRPGRESELWRDRLIELIEKHGHVQKEHRSGDGGAELRALVYVCGYGGFCGGLADRFEGVLVTFFASLISNRAFFINWTKPTDLENFYRPMGDGVGLDWRISTLSKQIRNRLQSGQAVVLRRRSDTMSCDKLVEMMKDPNGPPIIRLTTNHAKSCVVRIVKRELAFEIIPPDVMGLAFHWLFEESQMLSRAVRTFVIENRWSFEHGMCLHVRHGGKMGTLKSTVDPMRHVHLSAFWNCSRSENVMRDLRQRQLPSRCKPAIQEWLLISDDDSLLAEVHESLPQPNRVVHTQGVGPVLHVDKLGQYSHFRDVQRSIRSGEQRVMLDHALLKRCRVMLASHSAFSLSAAGISTAIERLYLVDWLRGNHGHHATPAPAPSRGLCPPLDPHGYW